MRLSRYFGALSTRHDSAGQKTAGDTAHDAQQRVFNLEHALLMAAGKAPITIERLRAILDVAGDDR